MDAPSVSLWLPLSVNLHAVTPSFAVQALYQDSHPEYLSYIYLISPISLLILNPIGFTLMEIHRHYSQDVTPATLETAGDVNGRRQRQDSTRSTDSVRSWGGHGPSGDHNEEGLKKEERTWSRALLKVARGVLLNPIIFMTAIGIAGNFVFEQKVPTILDDILVVLGECCADVLRVMVIVSIEKLFRFI